MLAIDVRNLRKTYKTASGGQHEALRGVDLQVQSGELFGFVGVNGAGKSTLIKSLLGLIRITSGEAFVYGAVAGSLEARRNIGYLPEVANYHEFMSATELLSIHAALSGVAPADRSRRCDECLDLVGLGARKTARLSEYSKGMKQRFGIAQALVGQPKLLILDELTSGLDPKAQLELRDITANLKQQGTTVFFSSHHMTEVEAMCDRVGILHRGLMRACGTLDELLNEPGYHVLQLKCPEESRSNFLSKNPSITAISSDTWHVPDSVLGETVAWLTTGAGSVVSLNQSRKSLEDFYMKLITRVDQEEAASV